ncbi:MAG: hypothetical protein ACXWNC_10040, partial [Anaerolineales bacterium]
NQSTALAAALLAHLSNYLFTGIFGLYALSNEGETLMGVYRQLQARRISARTNPSGAVEKAGGLTREPSVVPDPNVDGTKSLTDTGKKEES